MPTREDFDLIRQLRDDIAEQKGRSSRLASEGKIVSSHDAYQYIREMLFEHLGAVEKALEVALAFETIILVTQESGR